MSSNFVQVKPMYLQQIVGTGDTQFKFANFVDLAGNALTMADFGTEMYGTIDPNTSKEEAVLVTAVSAPVAGIVTFTVTRALRGKPPYGTGGTAYPHDPGAVFVVSNSPDLMKKFMQSDTDATITGAWLFSNPDAPQKAVTKSYYETTLAAALANKVGTTGDETVHGVKTFPEGILVPDGTNAQNPATIHQLQSVANFGAANATTDGPGIVELATPAEITAGTDISPTTGAPLVVQPSKLPKVLPATTTSYGVIKIVGAYDQVIGSPSVSMANPAVVTMASHGLIAGDKIKFTATDDLVSVVGNVTADSVSGASTVSATYDSTLGHTFVVGVMFNGVVDPVTVNVTDTAGNIYSLVRNARIVATTASAGVYVFSAKSTVSMAGNVITATRGTSSGVFSIQVVKIKNGDLVTPIDASQQGTATGLNVGTISISTAAYSSTKQGAFLGFSCGGYPNVTPGAGYTIMDSNPGHLLERKITTGGTLNEVTSFSYTSGASNSDYAYCIIGVSVTRVTTPTLPTGIDTVSDFFVISSGLTSNSFEFSATYGGSPVATSGMLVGAVLGLRQTSPILFGRPVISKLSRITSDLAISTAELPVEFNNEVYNEAGGRIASTSQVLLNAVASHTNTQNILSGAYSDYCQRLVTATGGYVKSVQMRLSGNGGTTVNTYLQIRKSSDNSLVAESALISFISTTPATYTYTFSNVILAPGDYYFVIRYTSSWLNMYWWNTKQSVVSDMYSTTSANGNMTTIVANSCLSMYIELDPTRYIKTEYSGLYQISANIVSTTSAYKILKVMGSVTGEIGRSSNVGAGGISIETAHRLVAGEYVYLTATYGASSAADVQIGSSLSIVRIAA